MNCEDINQNYTEECIKIGDKAPNFTAKTTFGEITLSDYKDKWVVFFSHPR